METKVLDNVSAYTWVKSQDGKHSIQFPHFSPTMSKIETPSAARVGGLLKCGATIAQGNLSPQTLLKLLNIIGNNFDSPKMDLVKSLIYMIDISLGPRDMKGISNNVIYWGKLTPYAASWMRSCSMTLSEGGEDCRSRP